MEGLLEPSWAQAAALRGNDVSVRPHGRLPESTPGCVLMSVLLRGAPWAPAEAASVYS